MIISSFKEIRKEENLSIILEECLFEIFKPEKSSKGNHILDFLYHQIKEIGGNPESIFLKILEHYKIGENNNNNNNRLHDNNNNHDDNLEHLKLFSFDLDIYQWILGHFEHSNVVVLKCYNEILSTKSYFDNFSLILTNNDNDNNNNHNNNNNNNRNNNKMQY